MSKIAKFWECY